LQPKKQLTPLHEACKGGHVEAVKFLIAHGADPKALTGLPRRKSAAVMAAKAGSVEILKILKENGVDLALATEVLKPCKLSFLS
jgi:ankyrin repeat protein